MACSTTGFFIVATGADSTLVILNRGSMPRKRTERKWYKFSRPECVTPQHDVTRNCTLIGLWPLAEGGLGWSMYSAFLGNCSVSYLFFVYWRSLLWAKLNDGENSLHWKANMLPLFSIMTLWLILVLRLTWHISIQCAPDIIFH